MATRRSLVATFHCRIRRVLRPEKEEHMSRWVAASCLLLCSVLPAYAQSPEEEVRKVNDATLTTAQQRDVAGYSKLLGDDLRWIEGGGNNPAGRSVITKAQRIANLKQPISQEAFNIALKRTHTETDVKVYGNIAVLICRSDFGPEGKRMAERVHRVFAHRDGAWVLVSHGTTPIASTETR